MKILIAPLNWGLGHATRCVQLVRQYMDEGHEVVLGGDGESLCWLKRYFPNLRAIELASLELHYSKHNSQVLAMLKALPQLLRFTLEDEARLNRLLMYEPFDMVISDNRFGLHHAHTRCVYITHQLWIRLPKAWRWLEPMTAALHKHIYERFDEVWVPDYPNVNENVNENENLSGVLGHPKKVSEKVKYIGPLSRFGMKDEQLKMKKLKTLVVLSGLEPQRTILENQLLERWAADGGSALIVQGKVKEPFTRIGHGQLEIVPYLSDEELVAAMMGAEKIICRSGYSTIMDLERLGLLHKAEFFPTPGQSEQEYLAYFVKNATFLCEK